MSTTAAIAAWIRSSPCPCYYIVATGARVTLRFIELYRYYTGATVSRCHRCRSRNFAQTLVTCRGDRTAAQYRRRGVLDDYCLATAGRIAASIRRRPCARDRILLRATPRCNCVNEDYCWTWVAGIEHRGRREHRRGRAFNRRNRRCATKRRRRCIDYGNQLIAVCCIAALIGGFPCPCERTCVATSMGHWPIAVTNRDSTATVAPGGAACRCRARIPATFHRGIARTTNSWRGRIYYRDCLGATRGVAGAVGCGPGARERAGVSTPI